MPIPKYKYLLTYRYAEIIYDLNTVFINKNIRKFSRMWEQMEQSGRSGKQCIVEAVGESIVTRKNEIKLLGFSNGSYEELLADYEDYLRNNNLEIYAKESKQIANFKQYGYRLSNLSNLSDLGFLKEKPQLPANPQDAANLLITLIHIETFLLDKQIKALINKFESEGGFTEQLLKGRLKNRKK